MEEYDKLNAIAEGAYGRVYRCTLLESWCWKDTIITRVVHRAKEVGTGRIVALKQIKMGIYMV